MIPEGGEERTAIAGSETQERYSVNQEDLCYIMRARMEEVLRMIGEGKLDVKSLITHEFPVENAAEAYDLILNRPTECIGVLLSYR